MSPTDTRPAPPVPAETLPEEESGPVRPRRRWPWIAAGAAALILLFLLTRGGRKDKAADQTAGPRGGAAARPIPVVAAVARKGELPVYVTGLGTVTPLSTVTVRSRVDGQLLRVNFKEGQLVHEGDLLVEIDPRPFQVQLTQAEGQAAKDRAALENARVDLARYQALIAQDAIPRQQLDTQVATVHQFEAALQSDQGQIDAAKLNITYSRITAPTTGRVGLRLVDTGNIVHANDANGLLVITQIQPITVVFTIPGDKLPQVLARMGPGKTLTVEAYDRDLKNRIATGTLLAVDNQIDPTTGTVKIKALFTNESFPLFPNQFVNARLLVDTLQGAVLVPAAAIQRSPQSTFVWVVKPDATVELRNVDTQLTEGDFTALRSGLQAGEQVVIDGVDKLQPGVKVAVTPPNGAQGSPNGAAPPGAPGRTGAAAPPAHGARKPAA